LAVPVALAKMLRMRSGTGNERQLAGLVPGASSSAREPNRRPAESRLPVGVLLYLVSVGLVATATIGVFFGMGFLLFDYPTNKWVRNYSNLDSVIEVKLMVSGALSHAYSDAPPIPGQAELSRSAAAAPVFLAVLAESSPAHNPIPRETSQATRHFAPVSPDSKVSASAPKDAPWSGNKPALKSTVRKASLAWTARTATAAEPMPGYQPSPAPVPPPASPRHLAKKKAKRQATPAPQIRHAIREKVNAGLVGMVSGSMDATGLEEATDLAIGLDGVRDHLRILPVVGKGAFQNVTDIVFARGIDIGIVQSDVLATLKRDPPFPGIENYLQYITKLYDEEVHILAGKEIASIEDLASKKVNFGMPGSGTHTSADRIFRALGISVEATSFPQPVGLEKLRRGEIAALVFVVGKPGHFFQEIRPDENLHFLSITATNDLRKAYTLANLSSEDYPDLIDPGRSISTVAVGRILAVYNWPARTEHYHKMAQFVQTFFDRLHDFQVPPHHPKWREIDVTTSVPGWRRFAAAQEWIRKAGFDSDDLPRNARLDELPRMTRRQS
jgi:TRAP-type uncharacterized transport system substrate-binding protein